jgi:hypothetical protein
MKMKTYTITEEILALVDQQRAPAGLSQAAMIRILLTEALKARGAKLPEGDQ